MSPGTCTLQRRYQLFQDAASDRTTGTLIPATETGMSLSIPQLLGSMSENERTLSSRDLKRSSDQKRKTPRAFINYRKSIVCSL